MPITFSAADVKLTCFPHKDAMVINAHIDKWDVSKVLIDNGSQVEILFLSTFDKMGYDRKQLRDTVNPLFGFSGNG